MVYDVSKILEVWSSHFALLSTPKTDMSYDNEHFISINKKVDDFNKSDESSIFLDPFTTREIQKAVNRLKSNKACGFDSICAEHVYANDYFNFALQPY